MGLEKFPPSKAMRILIRSKDRYLANNSCGSIALGGWSEHIPRAGRLQSTEFVLNRNGQHSVSFIHPLGQACRAHSCLIVERRF